LTLHYPVVPTFAVTRALVDAAAELQALVHLGSGAAGDAFYAPKDSKPSKSRCARAPFKMDDGKNSSAHQAHQTKIPAARRRGRLPSPRTHSRAGSSNEPS